MSITSTAPKRRRRITRTFSTETTMKRPTQVNPCKALKMILTTSCGFLLVHLLVGSLVQLTSGQQAESSLLQPPPQDNNNNGPLQQTSAQLLQSTPMLAAPASIPAGNQVRVPKQLELLVQPQAAVRIECKLPALVGQSNRSRTFYWNFQRTSQQDQKPDLLCYGTDCINAASYGIELEFDQAIGTYDLIINNATYELNDGIYYCDYRDTSPETRQTINREFRLTVLIPPQAPTISASSAAPPREGQEYQLNCQSTGGNPEPNISWFKNDQPLLATSGSGSSSSNLLRIEQIRQNGTTSSLLTWIPTIDDHQSIYKCQVINKAMNGLAPFEREVTLLVEYAPRISVGPFNPLKVMQGDQATISCQVDANPPVKGIRWFRDGHQLISHQYNHTISEIKISDASIYSCQADNGIAPVAASLLAASQTNGSPSSFFSFLGFSSSSSSGGSSNQASAHQYEGHSKTAVEARLQLEVLYGPRVQVRESRPQPLNQGDYFTLNCSVESWPPVYEYVWTKQEGDSFRRLSASTSPTLEFQSLTPNDMGNYTCTAFNRLEPSSFATTTAPATVGQTFERQGSASYMVLVRHQPGLAEIILGQQGETELGNRTQIQCRAKPPGYPEPKYSFWRWQTNAHGKTNKHLLNKNSVTQDSTYTLFSAKAEDEGQYACMASNMFGPSSEATGNLIVNEVPSIVHDKTWREEDARQPGYFPYSITVRASGKPEPRVAWFHRSPVDGRRIDLSSPEMQAKFRIETQSSFETKMVRGQQAGELVASGSANNAALGATRTKYIVLSTLTFKAPLEVDDRGLYQVEFSNGLSRVATESHQLHINHTPIPAIKNMPIVWQNLPSTSIVAHKTASPTAVTTRTRAGFNLGEQVNLTCRVSAYPQPQFVWHSQSNSGTNSLDKSLENDARYRTSVSNVQDDIWESTMSFELTSEADYGDYMCVTANQDAQTQLVSDSIRIIIHLGRKTIPEPPIQVEQIDATQDSVTLQWLPGFDGGFAQNQFIVQYAPDDNSGLPLMRRFGPLIEQQQPAITSENVEQQQPFPRLYDCLSMNPCTINNLQPRQAYLMRLRARNELGYSDFSDDLRVSTRANITQIPRIQEANFDSSKNILRFRVEPNPEYLLNNLEARIEVRGSSLSNSIEQQQSSDQATSNQEGEWRRYPSVPVRHEQGEAYLNMQPDSEQLRLTLCSRLNESLCGPEFILSTQSVTSSFLRDQQGLSISILASSLILILVLGGFATTLHSCCLSRKSKKAGSLDHVDSTGGDNGGNGHQDNKSLGGHVNGGLSLTNGNSHLPHQANHLKMSGSHGSTTSTNSTSATANGHLQSMDNNQLLMSANGGPASDHSSDHSRQAKLDSMLPPNYSHYADRASLMLEQQQQQQQAVYMQDKLTPFGLPNSALMQQLEPHVGDYFGSYDPTSGAVLSSLEHHEAPMMLGSVLNSQSSAMYDPNQMVQEASMYSTHQQHAQMMDDYNYNALAFANQQQQQHDQMMVESAYGTTTGPPPPAPSAQIIAQPTQASYENNANQSYCHQSYSYDPQQQQQQLDSNSSQYHQDLATAQQQMYGTLTRNASLNQANGYHHQSDPNATTTTSNITPPMANNDNSSPLSQQQQQQQDQYMSTTGLMPPPPPPPPQESDYGTTGGRNGRLIREIIV